MPSIHRLKIPGYSKGAGFLKARGASSSIEKEIKDFLKSNVLPYIRDNDSVEFIPKFDTNYLEKASEEGSEANVFFNKYISPILLELGKENDPTKLKNNIDKIKEDPSSYKKYSDSYLPKRVNYNKVSDEIKTVKDYLESNGSFSRDFEGAKGTLSAIKRSVIDSEADFLTSRLRDNPEENKDISNLIDDIYSELFKSGVTYPVAITVSGLKDKKGENLGKVRYAFPLKLPANEDYLTIEDDGSLSVSEEGINNIRKDYLTSSRIKKYSRMKVEDRAKKDLWLETLSALLKLADKQKSEGGDISYTLSGYPKYFNKKEREYTEEGQSKDKKKSSRLEVFRKINNHEDDNYKSLLRIANNNNISTPLKYIQNLLKKDTDAPDLKTAENLRNIEVSIPYKKIESEYHIKDSGNTGDSIFGTFQDSYLKQDMENPIPSRNLQTFLDSQLTKDEKESIKYIDKNLYDGVANSDPDVIKQFFVSDENGDLTLKESLLEHVSPIANLSTILWEDIFLKMKEEGYSDDIIEKRIKDVILALYGEVYLSLDEDSYKLGLQLANNSGISESDKVDLRRGEIDPNIIWNRYDAGGVQTPVSLFDMKSQFPDKIPNVTYADIREDLYENMHKSITNLLFTNY